VMHSDEPLRDEQPMSGAQVLESTREVWNSYLEQLRRGGFIWIKALGEELTANQDFALEVLGVMFSPGGPAEKEKLVEENRSTRGARLGKLVSQCPYNEQLAKRFERLKKGEPEEEYPEPPAAKAVEKEDPTIGPPKSDVSPYLL